MPADVPAGLDELADAPNQVSEPQTHDDGDQGDEVLKLGHSSRTTVRLGAVHLPM